MYISWEKRVYITSFDIACEEAKFVLKLIYSHCRCITHRSLRHRCAKDTIICIKYGTKEFIQVLVSKSLKWWLKLLATFHIMICHIFVSPLSQYLEFVGCTKYKTKEFTHKFQVWTEGGHKYMTDHDMKSC